MYALHHSVVFRTVLGFSAVSLCSHINSGCQVVSSSLASSDEVLFSARFSCYTFIISPQSWRLIIQQINPRQEK